LNVYENVEIPLLITKEKVSKDRVMEAIESVGLEKHIKHRPGELSGGQQQRVSIARAVVKNPKLILADEPTANLDQKTGMGIIDMLYKLKEIYHSTIVFCTHDVLVLKKAEVVFEIIDGQLTEVEK